MIRALAVAIGVALMVPSLAFARPRLAIVPIDGDPGGAVEDVIVKLIEDEFSVTTPRQVTRAMEELELELDPFLTTKQLKKLAKELEVTVIIRGELYSKGTRRVLHIMLFQNGKKLRGFKAEFGSTKSQKFRDALRDKLYERLGVGGKRADEPVADRGRDEDRDRGDKSDADKGSDRDEGAGRDRDADRSEDDEDPDGKRTARRDDEQEEDDEDIDGESEIEAGATVDTPHTANRAAVRVDFGPSVSTRSLRFSSRNFEQAPRAYSNSPVLGGRVEGEIYPLAFSKPNSVLAGLGIGGEFDQTAKLNVQSTAQPGTKFPVTQRHFSVGARLRFVFGKKPTSPSVTLGGGYMKRVFEVDRTQLMDGNVIDLPDVGYAGFNGGLELRIPIVRSVAIIAGGRAIFVTTTGDIQKSSEYGQAKVTGGEGQAGLDISIGNRMAVRVVGEATQFGFDFTGTGQQSNNRDGDPTTLDVGGAADRYIGGAVTFGVLY